MSLRRSLLRAVMVPLVVGMAAIGVAVTLLLAQSFPSWLQG